MSIVNNGKVSTNDQNVDKKKFDKNMDEINWNSKKGKRAKKTKATRAESPYAHAQKRQA